MSIPGIRSVSCSGTTAEVVARLETSVRARGMTVFARIDHAAGAALAKLVLRPTVLVIFGDARVGSRLMQAVQPIGLDLPLKALVWADADGRTWLGYTDLAWLAERYELPLDTTVVAIAAALAELVAEVVQQVPRSISA